MKNNESTPRPWKVERDLNYDAVIHDATGERILGYPWSGVIREIDSIMEVTVSIVNQHQELLDLIKTLVQGCEDILVLEGQKPSTEQLVKIYKKASAMRGLATAFLELNGQE